MKFLAGGIAPQEDFGLFQPDYSNIMYKNCHTSLDFKNLEEMIGKLLSGQTYSPEHCFSFSTVLVYIINPITWKKKKIRLVNDSCSNVTILEEEVSDEIELQGEDADVAFYGTGGQSKSFGGQKAVKFYLQSLDGKFTTPLIQAATLPKVMHGFEKVTVDPQNHEHLKNIKDFTEKLPMTKKHLKKIGKVQLLLGIPYEHHFGPQSKTLGPELTDPVAIHTPFGSCISAQSRKSSKSSQSTSNMGQDEVTKITIEEEDEEDKKIYPDITQFMRLDTIGISDSPEDGNDVTYEENKAREMILQGTTYCKTKKEYTTCLPWKNIRIQETNMSRALATAHQWVKKLSVKNPMMIDQWINAYQEMIDFGFI